MESVERWQSYTKRKKNCLAVLNDSGKSFKQIANIIEKSL